MAKDEARQFIGKTTTSELRVIAATRAIRRSTTSIAREHRLHHIDQLLGEPVLRRIGVELLLRASLPVEPDGRHDFAQRGRIGRTEGTSAVTRILTRCLKRRANRGPAGRSMLHSERGPPAEFLDT